MVNFRYIQSTTHRKTGLIILRNIRGRRQRISVCVVCAGILEAKPNHCVRFIAIVSLEPASLDANMDNAKLNTGIAKESQTVMNYTRIQYNRQSVVCEKDGRFDGAMN